MLHLSLSLSLSLSLRELIRMSSLFFYCFVRKTFAIPTFENNNAAKGKQMRQAGIKASNYKA
jgi:hypothetical protein